MNPAGAFIQIVFIVVSIGIGITYLQPTFSEIQEIQDDIEYYKGEIAKVQQVNARLAQLVSQQNSMLRSDRLALVTYVPDEVDVLKVMKDLVAIGEEADVEVSAITVGGGENANYFSRSSGLVPRTSFFSIDTVAEYTEVKTFLQLLEQNHYQLSVSELGLTPEGGDQSDDQEMKVSLSLMVFSLPDLAANFDGN